MDTARQVLRFSIPGSLLILWAIACFLILRRFQGVTFLESSNLIRDNVGALVAVLATIPIGFVVYQAYYFGYGPVVRTWHLPWDGRFVRLDRGSQILHHLEEDQIEALNEIFKTNLDVSKPYDRVHDPGWWFAHPVRKLYFWAGKLELNQTWLEVFPDKRNRKRCYERRWHENWDVLRAVLDISGSIEGSGQIKQEYTILSDIYHGLGASRKAITFGWLVVAILAILHFGRIESHWRGSIEGLAAITALTFFVNSALYVTRRRTWKSAAASLRLSLRWLFSVHAHQFVPKESKQERKRRQRERQENKTGSEGATLPEKLSGRGGKLVDQVQQAWESLLPGKPEAPPADDSIDEGKANPDEPPAAA